MHYNYEAKVQATGEHLRDTITNHWAMELCNQSKMSFYVGVKAGFGEEQYLSLQMTSHRVNISKLRSSSHDLRVD